jgi:hypothetical protein
MPLLCPVHKRRWMNSLETYIFSFVNDTALSSMNNLRKMKTLFLILSTIYNTHTQDPLSPSRIWYLNSEHRPADRSPPHNILTSIFKQILQYIVYLFIDILPTSYTHIHTYFLYFRIVLPYTAYEYTIQHK